MYLFLNSSSLVGKVNSNVGGEAVNEGEGESPEQRGAVKAGGQCWAGEAVIALESTTYLTSLRREDVFGRK